MIRSFRFKEARALLTLAIPVFLAQVAQTSMGFVDTVTAGRAGAVDMAAVAVACAFWFPGILFGQGLVMAITPLVAQSLGAGRAEGLGRYLRQGIWLGLGFALLLMLIMYGISVGVEQAESLEPDLARKTAGYLRAVLWGAPGMMLYCAQRCFLEGHGRTRPAMWAGFVGLLLNIPLNIIFVFGLFGMPALGGVGCGVATAIVCWVMAFMLLLSVRRAFPRALRWEAFSPLLVRRILRIGVPGAFSLLVEVSSFAVISLLIAPLGTTVVAGHQVAMNVSGLLFMVPLSLGAATSIRVGTCLGQGNLRDAALVWRTALCMALFGALVVALSVYFLRYPIARLYTDSPEVIALAVSLLVYECLYQFPDVTQMTAMSVLRAYNDTRVILRGVFFSYWLISLPLGYLLALTSVLTPRPLGVSGFWISIILGLTCAAAQFLWRVRSLEKLSAEAVKTKLNR